MFWTFAEPGQLGEGRVTIGGPSGHHLGRVLRVRPGERGVVVVSGREHDVEIDTVDSGNVVGRVLGDRPVGGEPAVAITLLQAALPNPDLDAVIENGTAVGIRRFVVVQAARSVAQPASARQARWESIARSAAEQSHRGAIPEVIGPVTLQAALERAEDARLLVLHPGATQSLGDVVGGGARAYTLAIGPEGGWTDTELSQMAERGGASVSLGPRILRARLAPIVATVILVQQR